ncbi:DsrE family protein [Haloarcula onubensis]|uniref:DsrE family protein n=1 Tax=Haloarcula onubensis TaxID=2950539 RepID=A0ABU2FKD7_9EURY|nr:DsrE family protein [Halomicroarcula sp. S3CR25-11]MDS0281214.1 DsrE family protein [Halomicroarcula sp. S3CR25-11]
MSSHRSILVHISSDDVSDWQMALRNLANLVNDGSVETPPELMEVVVNGPGVRFLLETSPEAAKVSQMAEAGVEITACANSLSRFDHAEQELATGVGTVQSGVAEVVRVQQRGDTYLKLP